MAWKLCGLFVLLFMIGTLRAETQYTWSLEDVKTGNLPDNWEVAETNGKKSYAVWEVQEDASVPLGKKALAIVSNPNRGEMGNLLFCQNGVFKNIEFSAQIKATTTAKDSGGGLVWRAVDENHYYLAHWNATTSHLRLYVYIGGKPSLLESVSVEADPDTWHQIDVVHYEETIEVLFDSESKISVEDNQLDFKGWVGLWAPGDAMPAFDNVNFYSEEDAE